MSKLTTLLALLFLCAIGAQAQSPFSGLISSSRTTDYTVVGLPSMIIYGSGGSACNGTTANCSETNPSPWQAASRVQTGSTYTCVNGSADPTALNSLMAGGKPGSYALYTGVCDINANLVMVSGVSLRGTDPQTASLNFTGANTQVTFGVSYPINSGALSATSYSVGTTSVTITGATCGTSCASDGLVAGNMMYINQCDTGWTGSGASGGTLNCTSGSYVDNFGIWRCGIDFSQCSTNSSGTGIHAYEQQSALIQSVTNNGGGSWTVTFAPGLVMPDWSSNNNATMFWLAESAETFGAAIENSTINFSYNTSEKIAFAEAYAPRVEGNRIIGFTDIADISYGNVLNSLVFSNVLFGNNYNNLGSSFSEMVVRGGDSNGLILNNIMEGGACVWANGTGGANVNAYNFCRDGHTAYASSIILTHNPFEFCRLDEGNSLSQIQYDDTHGTGDFCSTAFRNHVNMNDPPYITFTSTNARGIQIDNYHRVINIVNNIIETHGPNGDGATAYQGTSSSVGNVFVIPTSDQLATASLYRFGNWDSVTGSARHCVPGYAGFTSAPCNGASASSLTATESGSTVTVTSTLNPGTANPTIVTMTNCTPNGYNGMFQVTSSNGTSFQYTNYANSGLGSATGCTATLGSEDPTILAGNLSPYSNLSPSSATYPCSGFIPGQTSPSGCTPKYSGGTGISWYKVGTGCTFSPAFVSCSGSSTTAFPPHGEDITGGPYASGHAYPTPAEVAASNLPIDSSLQNSFTITSSSWSASCSNGNIGTYACETLGVSFSSIDNGSKEHIMGGFQLSGVNSACLPSGLPTNNEIRMTGSTTGQVQYALSSSSPDNGSSNQCTGTLKFPDIPKFNEQIYENDPAGSVVATPTFSPAAGSYGPAQTVTISDSTPSATICYTVNGSTPTAATPGTCDSNGGVEFTYSSAITVSSTETVKAIGTLATYTNSSVASATYTINGSAPAPTFSPVAGTYSGSQNVTISDSLGGATICFTTDGSTPTANGAGVCTHGSTYSATVAVTVSLTIKAIASESGYSDSSVGSAAYVILGINPPTSPQASFMQ